MRIPANPADPAFLDSEHSANFGECSANFGESAGAEVSENYRFGEFRRISAKSGESPPGPACSRRHSANIRRMSGEYPADIRRIALDLARIRRISVNFSEFQRIPARLLGATRRRDNNPANFGEFRRMRIVTHRNSANIRRMFGEHSADFCEFLRIPAECHPNELRSRKIRSPD